MGVTSCVKGQGDKEQARSDHRLHVAGVLGEEMGLFLWRGGVNAGGSELKREGKRPLHFLWRRALSLGTGHQGQGLEEDVQENSHFCFKNEDITASVHGCELSKWVTSHLFDA